MKKLFTILFLFICVSHTQAQKNKNDPTKLSTDLVKVLLESMPSPLETCILLKDTGAKYDSILLNHHYNVEHYDTHYKRALNFGVCLTDLGYASLYDESQAAINAITSIREMSHGLRIDEAFEFDDIVKILNNKIGLTEGFTSITGKIFNHLQQKKRDDISVLIMAGSWIEALYLGCSAESKKYNKVVLEHIVEQKITLSQLIFLLENYADNPKIKALSEELVILNKFYKKIKVETIANETVITVLPKDFRDIFRQILKIRSDIVAK